MHGRWHDELVVGAESWLLAEVDDSAFENQHCQHLVRAVYTDGSGRERVGIGVLEQNLLGPYKPTGLRASFDADTSDRPREFDESGPLRPTRPSKPAVMAPMTRSRASSTGDVTDMMVEYYRQRAGAGMIITEGVYPSDVGKGYCRTPAS